MTKTATWTLWEDMPLDEFHKRSQQAKAPTEKYVAEMRSLFSGMPTLTADDRVGAPRLRDGEHNVFLATMDVADMKPETFAGSADVDEGKDPNQLETNLIRERIEKQGRIRS